MNALKQGRPKSILKEKGAPPRKLSFSDSMEYTTCKGYQNPNFAPGVILPPTHVTTTLPPLQFGSAKPFEFTQDKIGDKLKNPIDDHVASTSTASTSGVKDCLMENSELEQHVQDPHGYISLEKLVDDMAYEVWECSRCLSMGHNAKDCTRKVRCWFCFRYGHFQKNCFDWKQSKLFKWVPRKDTNAFNESLVGKDKDSHLESVTDKVSTYQCLWIVD
jgi:hypothetical protein